MKKKSTSNTAAQKNAESLEEIIRKNVETIARIEQSFNQTRCTSDVVADAVARFCGAPAFFITHGVVFAAWLLWNWMAVVPKRLQWDPPPFGNLTIAVSLEAIFLSAFILMSQNRQQQLTDQRTRLLLQVDLLTEQEVSESIRVLQDIAKAVGARVAAPAVEALVEATDAEKIVEELEAAQPADGPK